MAHSPDEFLVVLVTMPDPDTAARVGRTLVEEKVRPFVWAECRG